MSNVNWLDFAGWVGIGLLGLILLSDELLGIARVWGLEPITERAVEGIKRGDWTLAILVGAIGPVFLLWWGVHLMTYLRVHG